MKETLRQTGEIDKGVWKLTKENDGQQLSVSVEDKIKVTLPESPTSGYLWSVTQLDTEVIIKMGEKFVEPKSLNKIGAGGKREFAFQALKPAATDITLTCKRPWESGEEPSSTFKVTVLIK
jgi:inhibitor of cysteine peptidase